MQASNVTELLFQQLNFRGERQKVISTNIANIDTPDFKTKELKFKDQLSKSNNDYNLKLSMTHKNHIALEKNDQKNSLELHEVKGLIEQNDGNNVNLDTQMSEMSKNSIMFSALQSSIKKDSTWFKTVIDASSKN
ncbi:MAG: flagellar basal body rod protein FlgB [Campylobacterota bacterium]|nr:flagellar basal body rod protein FlgB [Campylobacterota bacterium]